MKPKRIRAWHRALCKPSQAETHAKAIRELRAEIMTMLTPTTPSESEKL